MIGIGEQECGKARRRSGQRHLELEISTRRNRLIGLWAAQRMNLGSAAAVAYAGQIAGDTIADATDDAIVIRLADDLTVAGVPADLEVLREEFHRLGNIAAMERRKAASGSPGPPDAVWVCIWWHRSCATAFRTVCGCSALPLKWRVQLLLMI